MSMWDNLCAAAEEEDSDEELCLSTNAGVFRRRFFPVFYSDLDFRSFPNGSETGLWPVENDIDMQWIDSATGDPRVPVTPSVMVTRVGPIPDYTIRSPWPLNHIPLNRDVRGYGGRPATKVFLDALRLVGQIRVLSPEGSCSDSVRLMVVFDFRCRYYTQAGGGRTYLSPVADLEAANVPLLGQFFFSGVAQGRFRVLYDQVLQIRPQIVPVETAVPEQAVKLDLRVPEVKLKWNPDSTDADLVSSDNRLTLVKDIHNALPTNVMPIMVPGFIGPPAGGVPVPFFSVDQQTSADVSRLAVRAGLGGNNQTILGVPSHAVVTGPVVDPLTSSLAANTHTNVVEAVGSLHVDVDLEIDLLDRQFYTVFDDAGMISSGALWLVMSSTNHSARMQSAYDAGDSTLRSMLYYVTK